MPFVYVHPHVCVSVHAYSPHNPRHTGNIEHDKRRVVGHDDLWLGFAYFKILVNFAANEYWLDSCLHLYADSWSLNGITTRTMALGCLGVCEGCLSTILDCKKVLMVEFTKRSGYLRCAKTFFRRSHSSEK